jgi:hypothetical protein
MLYTEYEEQHGKPHPDADSFYRNQKVKEGDGVGQAMVVTHEMEDVKHEEEPSEAGVVEKEDDITEVEDPEIESDGS